MSPTLEFLKEHNIPYRDETSKELTLNVCPWCGKKRKCYINKEKGLYDCKSCGERGNLFKLKAKFGVVDNVGSLSDSEKDLKPLEWKLIETLHDDLWNNEKALEYLKSRGFTDETIEHFKLGYEEDAAGEWIAIPHIHNNELWNIKYRRFAGGDKTFKRVTGQPTILFNQDNVTETKDTLYVTEAEMDCIAAWQMGVENVVSLTGGAQSFKTEWVEFFAKFSKIYLLLDSDEPGQKAARKLAEKIGLKKVKNVVLPVKDVNEYMKTHTAEELKMLLSKATKFEMKNVSTMEDVVESWNDWFSGKDNAIKGLSTGYRALDHFTGGFKAGDLIVFSGNSGIGKTTFVNTMVSTVIRNGYPVLGFYLEGQINYMMARMIGAHYDLEHDQINRDPIQYEKIKEETRDLPLHWYSGPQGGMDLTFLREYIPAVVDLYGIKLIVVDNLQKVVRGSDSMYNQRVSETVSVLKDLAVDLKIPLLLIAHPKKTDPTINKTVTMYDAKSSSTIYQDADQYWILQRIKNERHLTIEKNRMGEDGVDIPLDVDMAKAIFREREAGPSTAPQQTDGDPLEENM